MFICDTPAHTMAPKLSPALGVHLLCATGASQQLPCRPSGNPGWDLQPSPWLQPQPCAGGALAQELGGCQTRDVAAPLESAKSWHFPQWWLGIPIALLSITPMLYWDARGGHVGSIRHPQNPGLAEITAPLARGFWHSHGEGLGRLGTPAGDSPLRLNPPC